jgi:hypothetical protein
MGKAIGIVVDVDSGDAFVASKAARNRVIAIG